MLEILKILPHVIIFCKYIILCNYDLIWDIKLMISGNRVFMFVVQLKILKCTENIKIHVFRNYGRVVVRKYLYICFLIIQVKLPLFHFYHSLWTMMKDILCKLSMGLGWKILNSFYTDVGIRAGITLQKDVYKGLHGMIMRKVELFIWV